jgi:hypothetical protein
LLPRVRFWLPVGLDQSPPEAYHSTLSVSYSPVERFEFAIEGYHKYQPNVLVLDYAASAVGVQPIERTDDPMISARGYAFGVSAGFKYRTERLNGRIQYDFSEARQRTPNRFGGRYTPVPWDVPHAVVLSADALLHRGISMSIRWQGLFGRRWGFRQAYYDFLEGGGRNTSFPPYDLTRPEDHRLPAFSQLDLGASFSTTVASADVQFRVMLVNVLGRKNVTDWSLVLVDGASLFETRPRLAASFIPSVSLRVSPW